MVKVSKNLEVRKYRGIFKDWLVICLGYGMYFK